MTFNPELNPHVEVFPNLWMKLWVIAVDSRESGLTKGWGSLTGFA